MFRGGLHHRPPPGNSYRRPYTNEDRLIELIQEFRKFKPYLKKLQSYLRGVNINTFEVTDMKSDVSFYLEVMDDILADESHGEDQLRGYIDKIHELIRKNPMANLPSNRRSIDEVAEEFNDNDRPRSPSPVRASDCADSKTPKIIPVHGSPHRTVDVNLFSSQRGESSSKNNDEVDEWDQPTRPQPYKQDVDMRNNCYNSSGLGRGHQSWKEEHDGARSMGRGMGRGASVHNRNDDWNSTESHNRISGSGRGYYPKEYDYHRNDPPFHLDRNDIHPKIERPDWLKDEPANGNSNPNQNNGGGHRHDFELERRHMGADYVMRKEMEDRKKYLETVAQTRRPPSESRQDVNDLLMDRQNRGNDSTAAAGTRDDPGPHGFGFGRSDDRHMRSGYTSGVSPVGYPPQPMMSPFGGVPHAPGMYPNLNPGLLPTPPPPFGPGGMPHHPVYHPGGMGHPPMQHGVPSHSMGYRHPPPPPPNTAYPRPGLIQTPPPNYHIPPPIMPRLRPPHPTHIPPSHPPPPPNEDYQGYPTYTSPSEPSPEQMREMAATKAKNCFSFNRIAHRVLSTNASSIPSSSASPASPPSSPTEDTPHSSSSLRNATDPRLNRGNKPSLSIPSHPRPPPPGPQRPNASAATRPPDAGNVLRVSVDPRSRVPMSENDRRMMEAKKRVMQKESQRPQNKVSKLQEFRRQLEKEPFFKLGKHPPKKQCGSFEDALSSCDQVEPESSDTSKAADKSRTSSSQAKDKDGEDGRQQRSQSDKTDKEKGSKKGKDTSESKEKSRHREQTEMHKKSRKKDKGTKAKEKISDKQKRSSKKKDGKKNKLPEPPSFDASLEQSNSLEKQSQNIVDHSKPPTFKIPRKPKPKSDTKSKESKSPSQPYSPEPALSQVPDVDSRINDDIEPSATSKSTSQASSTTSTDGFELLKQFVLTTRPAEGEVLLSNPDKLKEVIAKVMSELDRASASSSGHPISNAQNDTDADNRDTSIEQDKEADDDTPTRGRSREKKRNSKRRSSLEKLHDALKEMRFDTMLPLGPRRCTTRADSTSEESTETSGGQGDTVSEDQSFSSSNSVIEIDRNPTKVDKKGKQGTKKRGRPTKPPTAKTKAPAAPKKGKKATAKGTTKQNETSATPSDAPPPLIATNQKGTGTKRKLKPTKVSPAKRVKKSGPVTRAQAALKKSKEVTKKLPAKKLGRVKGVLENESGDALQRSEKQHNRILRRLNRRQIGSKDTVSNTGLGKVKLESDYIPPVPVKAESHCEIDPLAFPLTEEQDLFENYDSSLLGDQLQAFLQENLIDPTFNLDKQTDDNMDLTVFNSLEIPDQIEQPTTKEQAELKLLPDDVDLPYDSLINGSSSRKLGNRTSSLPSTTTKFIDNMEIRDISPTRPVIKINQSANLVPTSSNLNTVQQPSTVPATQESLSSNESNDASLSAPSLFFSSGDRDETNSSQSSDESLKGSGVPATVNEPTIKHLPLIPFPTMDGKRDSVISDAISNSSSSSSFDSQPLIPTKPAINEDVKGTNLSETVCPTTPVKLESMDSENSDELRKFKCELCSFSGKKIVSHYVNKHHPCNIPQAKLQKETFDGLVEMNVSGSPQLLEITLDNNHAEIWPCLYCDSRFNCIVEYYDHLTTHTGEFRFQCGECGISYPFQKSLTNHVKQHKGVTKNCIKILYTSGIDKTSKDLCGFMCNDCFYFQLRFQNITHHIEKTGHDEKEVKFVKMVLPSDNNSVKNDGNLNPVIKVEINQLIKQEIPDINNEAAFVGSEGTEAVIFPIDEKKNLEVFFGTNMNFSPEKVALTEGPKNMNPVFKHKFLDSLLRKVCVPNPEEISIDDDDDLELYDNDSLSADTRKRKRSFSLNEDDDNGISQDSNIDSSGENENPAKITKLSTKNLNLPILPNVPKLRTNPPQRVCILKKLRNKAKLKSLELNLEEPNNFYASSDDASSEESSSEESDIETEFNPLKVKNEILDSDEEAELENVGEGYLRNNEHIILSKTFETDKYLEAYMKKRELVYIRRPGDLHAPNTVLFGYIKETAGSAKLRDPKEVDRLGGVFGNRVIPMKGLNNLNEMLTKDKLMHLFKCMSTYCSFTTDCSAEFLQHLQYQHVPIPHDDSPAKESCARFAEVDEALMMKDADCCPYCSARYKHHRDLVHHIINQHSQSVYQCNKCFYRSYYQRYVVRHFDVEHPNEEIHIYKCQRKVQAPTKEATLFQIFVYKCNIDNPNCDKTRRFVFREDYLEHLENCGPRQDMYQCHLCKTEVTFENLIEHYKVHNLFKFHCSYCLFGSEIKTDLDEHFVRVHPNTSGRVFYRVKPSSPDSPVGNIITPPSSSISKGAIVEEHTARSDENRSDIDGSSNSESASISGVDEEDGEKGRVTNLKGRDLYRCVTGQCKFSSDNSETFKEHVMNCDLVTDSRSLACAHCERKLKTVTNLLEHMKVHGEKKQVCSICSFRCWTSTEITKHIKTVHRVMSYKLIKKEATITDVDPDVVAFPKDVFVKALCDIATFEKNYYLLTRKAVYSFENIDKLPNSKIFSADLLCAMCPYSTKVRTNIIRHLTIHKSALEDGRTIVPDKPRINPVPYLSREGLEFDKMMNLAASSHKTDGGTATADDVRKLPQFVKEQFRYVCSVCDHITSDDALLQTHIKVIHSEVLSYKCPHCQKSPDSKDNPEYNVPLDKISHHLRLHGPKLYKCGHCMVVHHQLRLMEKHIPEKHPEKKPIHYLIRDVDPDGAPSNRSGTIRRQSVDDPKGQNAEKWRCFLCSSKSIFGSWEETKSHCETVHKVNSQFMCLVCDFVSDDVTDTLTHCRENCPSEEKNKILVMFSKCQPSEGEDCGGNSPAWKRYGGAVRHIHGNFTEDSVSLIKQYNSQQSGEPVFLSPSPIKGSSLQISTKNNPMKSTPPSGGKARRSIGGPGSSKTNTSPSSKTIVLTPSPILPKPEVFKFRCHKCDIFKTKNPSELRVHLYNEFRYKRWKCLTCNTTFTTEKSLKGHIERDHQKVYTDNLYILEPANTEIESEITDAIDKQSRKRDFINSYILEKQGKLTCKFCKDEEGFTYETLETHIFQLHSGITQ